jgi:hypothetical protein
MRTSCINFPPNDQITINRASLVAICDGEKRYSKILSYLIYTKEAPSEGLTYNEIYDGILGEVGLNKIKDGIKFLKEKGFISVYKNPNPKYAFDQTNYYLVHDDIINSAIDNIYKASSKPNLD